MVNDNDYGNPFDESNDEKKRNNWVTKIITLLLTCVAIKTIIVEIDRNHNDNDNIINN